MIQNNIQCIDITEIDFEVFKSNVCQHIKKEKPNFIIDKILEYKLIDKAFEVKEYANGLYLVAIINYLSNKYHLNKNITKYDKYKLKEPIYPSKAILMSLLGDESYKEEAYRNAEPEFLKYNIVEGEIENVY